MKKNKIDFISKEIIEKNISEAVALKILDSTDSTNSRLKEEAKSGAKAGTVIIAESQTGGRGRLGRSFHSPSQSGIYMSLLIRPTEETDIGLITAYTAVAVCKALEKAGSTPLGIKWVNDIIKDKKKVCGILAEAGIENGKLEYIIVGIGINVYPPEDDFPTDIKSIAESVFNIPRPNAKNEIISEILNSFFNASQNSPTVFFDNSFIEEYRKRSVIIGKKINVHQKNEIKEAFALHIDDRCNLIVRYENGETEALSFGEISVRVSQ